MTTELHPADLTDLSLSALADLYNRLAEKPITKFKDKPTGIDRVAALGDRLGREVLTDGDGDYAWSEPKSEPEAPVLTPEQSAGVAQAGASASLVVGIPAGAGKSSRRGPAPRHADDAVIRVLVETNPKRKGSSARERFALYRDGMTVAEYLGACAKKQGGEPGEYRMDFIWDEERKYVRFEEAGAAPAEAAPEPEAQKTAA